MGSEIELFTALAASLGAIGGVAKGVEVWRDREGVRVRTSITLEGRALTPSLSITAYCLRHPVTLDGFGLDLIGIGAITAPVEDVELVEGKSHRFALPVERIQAALHQHVGAEVGNAFVRANGKRFDRRLGFNEITQLFGHAPTGPAWWLTAAKSVFLPRARRWRMNARKVVKNRNETGDSEAAESGGLVP